MESSKRGSIKTVIFRVNENHQMNEYKEIKALNKEKTSKLQADES